MPFMCVLMSDMLITLVFHLLPKEDVRVQQPKYLQNGN